MTAALWHKLATKESHVQRAVLDYLAAEGILAIRLNAGETERDGRRIRLAPAGTPDIVAQIPWGRLVRWPDEEVLERTYAVAIICWIECKRFKGGTLALNQRMFQQRAAQEGAFYILARSLDDAMRAIPPKRAGGLR